MSGTWVLNICCDDDDGYYYLLYALKNTNSLLTLNTIFEFKIFFLALYPHKGVFVSFCYSSPPAPTQALSAEFWPLPLSILFCLTSVY